MSDVEDPIDLNDEGGDDLFGDDDIADDNQSDKGRAASDDDDDLASDRDANETRARYDDDDQMNIDDEETKEKIIMSVDVMRHKTPKHKDGQMKSMRVPKFLKINAEEYKPDTFEPSVWDSENVRSDAPKSVVRYQRDPQTGQLKSNALVYRWSDGSVTIAVGGEHYEMQSKTMAPPPNGAYEEQKDAHYYVAAANLHSNLLMTVGHVSEQYTVRASKNMQDEALAKFANDMAAAARGRRAGGADSMIITATKDPELQMKEAEMAEKERAKAQRRSENAAARMNARVGGYRGGLSVGDLEGGRKSGGARKRGAPGASRQRRHKPEYDSDDDLPPGPRRGDDYNLEDDFIAPSDEDAMSGVVDDDDEEDILDDDEEEEERPRKKRQRTVDENEDADADADADDEPAPETSRGGRRRQIVDDDDDDDEE